WGFGLASHKEIDELNILKASLLAMKRAFFMMKENLPAWLSSQGLDPSLSENKNILAIVDGLYVPPKLCCDAHAAVKADGKFPCVMAASIIAKVGRDRLMVKYDQLYPGYGYAKHKGYPTQAHFEACAKLGPSPIQRMCFAKDKQ
ncbi:MAG: ribonuclease HII, partial [Treponema sp.]|nr:ribonuclease HII [Treponema sp.]